MAEWDAWPESPPPTSRPRVRKRQQLDESWPWPDSGTDQHLANQKKTTGPLPDTKKAKLIKEVNFSFTGSIAKALTSRHSDQQAAEPDKHAKKAMDPEQVRHRLDNANCYCQRRCHKMISYKTLLSTCQTLWSMPKEERSHLLRTLYEAAMEEPEEDSVTDPADSREDFFDRHRRRFWYLCGHRVCFKNFVKLLGTSEKTIRKYIENIPDRRKGGLSCRPAISSSANSVDFFFYELYHSAAEPLPCRPGSSGTKRKRKSLTEDTDLWYDDKPWLAEDVFDVQDDNVAPESLTDWNPDNSTVNDLVKFTVGSAASVIGLPQRWIQHTHLHDLYWLFEASWDHLRAQSPDVLAPVPSYSAFVQRWQVWKRFIRIRKIAQHAQCQTCWDLQQSMNAKGASWPQRLEAARNLRVHYQRQYTDRTIYWSARWASRYTGTILCIIIDSMDKTKMAWPRCWSQVIVFTFSQQLTNMLRWPFERKPKNMEGLVRPRFVLTAAIAHGWFTSFFAQNEYLNHGSSHFCEILVRTLDRVWVESQTSGRPFPQHLIIQSDNTVAQAKNSSYLSSWRGWLPNISSYPQTYFSSSWGTHMRIPVELFVWPVHVAFLCLPTITNQTQAGQDVDQLFGLVLSLILSRKVFQTPEEFMDLLDVEFRDRVSAKGERLTTEVISGVRDFKSWLAPMRCQLQHAFGNRFGIEAPHAFSFKFRQDLCHADVHDVDRPGILLPGHPLDVMVCVKAYMASRNLQDPPTLVIPHRSLTNVNSSEPLDSKHLHPLTEGSIKAYFALASICDEISSHDMSKAASALRTLATDRTCVLPWSRFLSQNHPPRLREKELGHPMFPHLPDVSWRLVSRTR